MLLFCSMVWFGVSKIPLSRYWSLSYARAARTERIACATPFFFYLATGGFLSSLTLTCTMRVNSAIYGRGPAQTVVGWTLAKGMCWAPFTRRSWTHPCFCGSNRIVTPMTAHTMTPNTGPIQETEVRKARTGRRFQTNKYLVWPPSPWRRSDSI